MIGRKVGHYHITRPIGKGGMGQVYEAVHEEIERRAAIKLLLPQYTNDPEAAARFLNEARAVNIVQHPSLINIFEFGRLDDGTAYIVMEYLEGETLRHRLVRSGGRLGSDAVRITRQIASALAAAHAKGIVHRDLKPANLMLVSDSDVVGGERVKVLDFGIAKLTENQAPGQVETRTGTVLGSPSYMSPEQCRNVGKVDDRSDVYALGVILYEMIAGRQPFYSQSEAEIMAMQMYAVPLPLHELVPDVSPELAALTQRMLHKIAAERPAMQDVLATLNLIGGYTSLGPGSGSGSGRAPVIPDAPTLAGTLSRATGVGTVQTQSRWRVRSLFISGGVVLATLFTSFLVAQQLQQPRHKSATSQTITTSSSSSEQTPSTIRWSIDSEPSGAQIWSVDGATQLGETPYSALVPKQAGVAQLVLKLAGYLATPITLDRATSSARTVSLLSAVSPEATASAGQNPPPSVGKSGKIKSKPRSSRIKNADIELIK